MRGDRRRGGIYKGRETENTYIKLKKWESRILKKLPPPQLLEGMPRLLYFEKKKTEILGED